MRVLIACEYSGVTRRAFRALGHDAFSCDLEPSEDDSPYHYQQDVLPLLKEPWDLLIAHPPCTFLAVAGARWFTGWEQEQDEALDFVLEFMNCNVPRIAIENPVSVISTRIEKPTQIIQPWMFGHGETKKTCLWLYNLPKLQPTNIVEGRDPRIHHMAPSEDRGKKRSRSYDGIAQAMATQWGIL